MRHQHGPKAMRSDACRNDTATASHSTSLRNFSRCRDEREDSFASTELYVRARRRNSCQEACKLAAYITRRGRRTQGMGALLCAHHMYAGFVNALRIRGDAGELCPMTTLPLVASEMRWRPQQRGRHREHLPLGKRTVRGADSALAGSAQRFTLSVCSKCRQRSCEQSLLPCAESNTR